MSEPDLEALVTPRIKEAVRAAIEKVGEKDFQSLAGLSPEQIRRTLESDSEYLRVKQVSLACKINKTHGDPNPNHSSITECLKGSVMKLPQSQTRHASHEKTQTPVQVETLSPRRAPGPLYDQKTVKILNFSANTISLLILGYFLGGIALAPLFRLQPCVGVTFSPVTLSPCLGSVLGLFLGSMVGLAYTYYYFVRKL